MRIGKFSFQPALAPSLIAFVLLPLLLSLGFWQLDRARQKATLQARFEASIDLPYAPLATVDPTRPESRYRRVIAQGRYDSGQQILLDNQIQNGQPGYQVFTPLRLDAQEQAILVERGWVPLGVSRQVLPEIAVTAAPVSVTGRISQPPNPGLRLMEPAVDARHWPRVAQYIDYAQLSSVLGYPLAPAVILLDPEAAHGYRREWQPRFDEFGPERHRAYAVQWFSLAAALAIIYIGVNTRRHPGKARNSNS